jgi:hypothetical protein
MSRFEHGRWNRILVWTGAALAWGSAVIAARFEPIPGGEASTSQTGQVETVEVERVMPNPPARGLIVIRYGKEQAIQVPAPPTQNLAPAVAPELTSSGS